MCNCAAEKNRSDRLLGTRATDRVGQIMLKFVPLCYFNMLKIVPISISNSMVLSAIWD